MQFAKPSLLIQNLGKVFPWEKMLMFPNTFFCILISLLKIYMFLVFKVSKKNLKHNSYNAMRYLVDSNYFILS